MQEETLSKVKNLAESVNAAIVDYRIVLPIQTTPQPTATFPKLLQAIYKRFRKKERITEWNPPP
jgi:hypothetical protein